MRAIRILFAISFCGFASIAVAENVGTTNDGGLKVGPKPKPKPAPTGPILTPTTNNDSGAFGTKPKGPVITQPKGPVTQKPPPIVTTAPPSNIVSSGQATLKATYTFDFDKGNGTGDGDLFYNHRDEVIRFLRPQRGVALALLPRADFTKTDADRLRTLPYSDTSINASDNADNQLRRGVIIAIKTRSGHFAKMRVTSYGRDLGFEWVTYR